MNKEFHFHATLIKDETDLGCAPLEQAKEGICYLEHLAIMPAYHQKSLGQQLVKLI
ncbi:MAG: hypothetical protein L3J69_12005 [Desulfobacula sp.]|nr:hypothetical protein [Desulfobacula sp.]